MNYTFQTLVSLIILVSLNQNSGSTRAVDFTWNYYVPYRSHRNSTILRKSPLEIAVFVNSHPISHIERRSLFLSISLHDWSINFSLGKAVISDSARHFSSNASKLTLEPIVLFRNGYQGEELIFSYMTTGGCHYLNSSKNRNKTPIFVRWNYYGSYTLAYAVGEASHRNSTFLEEW